MNGASSRRKGYNAENDVVNYLRLNGAPHAERRAPGTDGPDITGTPGIAWEIKNQAKLCLSEWADQAETQRLIKNDAYAPLVVKRRGKANPGEWFTILPLSAFCELLIEAGYLVAPEDMLAEMQHKVRVLNQERRDIQGGVA